MRLRLVSVLVVAFASALIAASAAHAHQGGKAEPRIAAGLQGQGVSRDLIVRLTDIDDGDPISGATVTATASMSRPHVMQLEPWTIPEARSGTYRARVRFAMPATWTIRIDVRGADVVSASSTLRTTIRATGSTTSTPSPPVTVLPTRIDDTLQRSDLTRMAVLWVHGLAALGWIVGVIVMAVALSANPAPLADGVRARLSAWYRRTGAWLHWSLVPVIVVTGVYQMFYVTPFSLAWTPDEVRRLVDVPYGALYEAILIVKLGLFGALLITGTQLLRRTVHSSRARAEASSGGALRMLVASLGAPGLAYVACVPLILAAAMALRYVHILSHVATVLNESS